jgi:hypothetical protein
MAPVVLPLCMLSTNDHGTTHFKQTTVFALPLALFASAGILMSGVVCRFAWTYGEDFSGNPYVTRAPCRECSLCGALCVCGALTYDVMCGVHAAPQGVLRGPPMSSGAAKCSSCAFIGRTTRSFLISLGMHGCVNGIVRVSL